MSKVRRSIVEIDESLCDGCGICVPSCMEGAIKIVDGKARLVSESLCDGLGACVDVCPKGAIRVVEKEVKPFDDSAITHSEIKCECDEITDGLLSNWPIKLRLVPAHSPQLRGASILISSDCVAYAYPGFHRTILNGKKLLIGCPKLDPVEQYVKKLSEMINLMRPKDITLAIMDIPCCRRFVSILKAALSAAGPDIPVEIVTLSTGGELLRREKRLQR